ncbi:uncharacterized protein LOC124370335 [Homalodisca vitripennis]|uniref:uncharacterized protein LOC124370335 n=1 Tax=Homalodisca vitripennis TaxID=197043 RepID=UPI001EECA7A5|nr:uncharacterized protein LOC124370335 [Homalodisca vitripennis]
MSEFTECLICEVQKRSILWNMKDNNYHNRHASNRAWESSGHCFGENKNLNLHEILTMLEDEEIQVPPDEEIGVYIQPPINANDDVTDEDSGDEDMTSIHHLPGNQLLAPAEVSQEFELSETVKGKWKNLSDTFRRELKKVPGYRYGSDGDQAPKYTGHWPYFERMLFLRGVMTPRPTDSNMSVTDEERNENNIDTITHESDPDDPGTKRHLIYLKRRKLTGSEQFKADILALEAKKINMLEKDSDQNDDDLNFFKSLLPHMKTLPAVNKLFFRSKVQNMLAEEMMNANRPHYATFPNTFVRTTPQTPVTTPETTSHATTSSGRTPASTPDVIVHQDLNTDETQSQSILLWNLN